MAPPPSSSSWPRPRLPPGALRAGGPLLLLLQLLGLGGRLLGGHSEDRGGACGGGGGGGRVGRLHAQLSLEAVGEAGEARRRRLLLVALALALVAEELARPHAQEALGAGVRAHGERRVGRRQRPGEGPAVGAGEGRLHQQGRGQVLAAVDRVGRVARRRLPWR